MKTELARICASILGLVVCAAAQDLSPAVRGAKPPILLAFGCLAGIPTAVIAGLFADSLGALPFGCSPIFFLAAAIPVRLSKAAATATVIAAAGAYQLWLALWTSRDSLMAGTLGAFAAAAVIAPAMSLALRRARRIIGIDTGGDRQ